MNLADQALDAAANVLSQQILGCPWSELNDQTSHAISSDAQAILEAAAPHIAAEAWLVGVRDGERNAALGTSTPNPYQEGAK